MIPLRSPLHAAGRSCPTCKVPGRITSAAPGTTGSVLYSPPAQPATFPLGPFVAMVTTWGLLGVALYFTFSGTTVGQVFRRGGGTTAAPSKPRLKLRIRKKPKLKFPTRP